MWGYCCYFWPCAKNIEGAAGDEKGAEQKEKVLSITGGNIRKETASGSLTVGTDMLSGELLARQPVARVIKGVAICGSAAAGDMVAELFVNGQSYGKFENSSTGVAIDMTKDKKPVNVFVPANALVELKITDAGGTNAAVAYVEFSPPQRGRSMFRRSGSRRRSYGARRAYGRGVPGTY